VSAPVSSCRICTDMCQFFLLSCISLAHLAPLGI
jgi:hypothetical protein